MDDEWVVVMVVVEEVSWVVEDDMAWKILPEVAREANELLRGGGVSREGESCLDILSVSGLLRWEVCIMLDRIPKIRGGRWGMSEGVL